ncbi:ROK family protein [Marinilabiliaceae bacterium ANBcel2]|nr:ROK family protein [Marinilabiliaceae bacterium ANBcel2]
MKSYIGVDIGGTKMQIAKVCNNKVEESVTVPTLAKRTRSEIFNDLVDGISKVIDDDVVGLGVGVPGLVDDKNGVIFNITNIPSWKNFDIRSELSKHFNIPVFVGNDANCFVLGEKHFGKAFGYSNVVGIALGTGVGGGVIVNGVLHTGNKFMAGEFGGISYRDKDFENYCSGKFFVNEYNTEGAECAQLAKSKDSKALEIFKVLGNHVGNLLTTIICSCAPDIIVIGGSLAKSYKFFEPGIREVFDKFPHQMVLDATPVVVSDNNDIAVLGAAALVLNSVVAEPSN